MAGFAGFSADGVEGEEAAGEEAAGALELLWLLETGALFGRLEAVPAEDAGPSTDVG